jgi:hypothetical protein
MAWRQRSTLGGRLGSVRVEHAGVDEDVVASEPGEDSVVDGARLTDQLQHPPQAPRVVLGLVGAVPLVEASIRSACVVGEPQLGDEPRKADEQWCVEKAFHPEQGVSDPADPP